MIAMRDDAVSALRGVPTGHTRRLSIGASRTANLRWVPELASEFWGRHPLVRVEIVSADPEKLLADVADRKIDAAFLPTQPIAHRPRSDGVFSPLSTFTAHETFWRALPRAGRSHTQKR